MSFPPYCLLCLPAPPPAVSFYLLQSTTSHPTPPPHPSAERVRRALVSRLLAPAADPQLSAAFPPFVPRIDALGGSLGRLLTVNRTVHAPTYNRLIAEAAAARVAGGGVVGAVVA